MTSFYLIITMLHAFFFFLMSMVFFVFGMRKHSKEYFPWAMRMIGFVVLSFVWPILDIYIFIKRKEYGIVES